MDRFEVPVDGAVLAGERGGDGSPAAVLLHAGVCDRRAWASTAAVLAADRTVLSYDRRGFGETTTTPAEHRLVDDLLAVLDAQLGPDPVWLVGNSQGGRVAVDAALAHPDRVAGLVLIAPAVTGAPDGPLTPAEQALSDAVDAAEDAGDDAEVNRLEAHAWLDGPSAPEGRITGPARDLLLSMNAIALAADDPGTAIDAPDAWSRLEDIAVPVLVVLGELDFGEANDTNTELARRLPRGELRVLHDAAHLPALERPEEVAGLIAAFLAANC